MTKVLIADDEPNILLSLDYLLRRQGYQVFVARNGREALDIIEEEQPRVVLLDIMMPELDGLEVCKAIRNRPDSRHYKIIFLSARSQPLDIEEGYSIGADCYFAKPFSTRQLVVKIKELLEED